MKTLTCATCCFFNRSDVDSISTNAFICTRYPPTVGLVVVQTSLLGSAPAGMTLYPQITKDTPACGEFKCELQSSGSTPPSDNH